MRKLSQLELLDEGFWNSFTKPARVAAGLARGAVSGAAKTLDYVLPELTRPLKGVENAARDIGSSIKGGYEKGSMNKMDYISKKLNDVGYALKNDSVLKRSGDNYVIAAYRITHTDPNGNDVLEAKPTPILIDKNYDIIQNNRNSRLQASTFPKKKRTV